MVKLFLAEDEIAMREGIKKHINWAEENIEFCGEASDGELAWPLIREKRPDIVITDIKMPFMDGLQLASLIRRELPDTRIIILSGYSEFSYAQEALRLGVAEYLLKPITPRSLREVISRVAQSVREDKKKQAERIDWLEEETREKKENSSRRVFRALISENIPSHEILALADEMQIRLVAPFYQILLVYISYKETVRNQELADSLLETMADGIEDCYLFAYTVDSKAVLLTAKTPEGLSAKRVQLEERITALVHSLEEPRYFISEGRPVRHLGEICQAYREANRAFSYRFFTPSDQVVQADAASIRQLMQENNPNPINTDTALQNGNLRGIWDNFMRTGTLGETEDFVEDVLASVGEDNLHSLLFLSYLTMDCYFSMARFVREIGREHEEITRQVGDINTAMGSLKSAEDAKRYLTGYLQDVIRLRDSSASSRNSQILQKALAYIDENFTDGDLSLQKTASVAGLSPNRFSALFSREMEMTFIEYLISKRMDRACELLMTTDLKSFEVAYESGYNDPHYFSATFKKIKGMSPMDYRKRGREQPAG